MVVLFTVSGSGASAAAGVLGQRLNLDGEAYTVIGVAGRLIWGAAGQIGDRDRGGFALGK
jgi:hypothetical protein